MKLNEIKTEGDHKYKQWKHGDVVMDRTGKVHIVDKQDDVKVFMKGQSHGHVHPNNLTAADPDIVDAAKSVGTTAELSDVYDYIVKLMSKVKTMSEGELKSLLDKSKGKDKFAVRVALKAAGMREPVLESTDVPTDDSWYVLDVRKKTILAGELTRDEAYKKAKELGGTVWFTEGGVFYNKTRDVSYPGRGWIDKS